MNDRQHAQQPVALALGNAACVRQVHVVGKPDDDAAGRHLVQVDIDRQEAPVFQVFKGQAASAGQKARGPPPRDKLRWDAECRRMGRALVETFRMIASSRSKSQTPRENLPISLP